MQLLQVTTRDRLWVGWLNGSGRGTARAEDAQGTPTQSHISPSILVYEDTNRERAGFLEPRVELVKQSIFFFSALLLSSLELSDTKHFEP